ncbi:MAG: hypothetical protein FWE37_01120 [Spirochaetaceae bacterium]|nr:hypothetical protein [Spirochaetaceae bacterium]
MKKIALLVLLSLIATNSYAVGVGLGVKGGSGIGFVDSVAFTGSGSDATSVRDFGLANGIELFVNLNFNPLMALQVAVAFGGFNSLGSDHRTRERTDGSWSSWETSSRNDITTQINSLGVETLFRINIPLANLYASLGGQIGYSFMVHSSADDTSVGFPYMDFAGVAEAGIELPIGPGGLIIALRSRFGISLDFYNSTNGYLDYRLIRDFVALRAGYAWNF